MDFWDSKESFQIPPCYHVLIEKPKIKHLSNIELLYELPFYNELSVVKKSNAFKGYGRIYKVEIMESKDPLVQLEDLLKNILNEMKCFKYQIAMIVLLYKHKMDGDTEYSTVYFASATITVVNFEYFLDNSYQEILYRIDNWINKRCG